jgi:hypothetical protein
LGSALKQSIKLVNYSVACFTLAVAVILSGCGAVAPVLDSANLNPAPTQGQPIGPTMIQTGPCAPGGTPFGGGTGTSGDPYLICSPTHFNSVTLNPDPSSHYVLTSNVNMGGVTWAGPVANFSGVFSGNGNVITNLSYSGTGNDIAVFRQLSGKIQFVFFHSTTITSNGNNAAILVANSAPSAVIEYAYVTASTLNTTGTTNAGCIVANHAGNLSFSGVESCVVNGSGTNNVGLVVGNNSGGMIDNSYADGYLSGKNNVGGVAGLVTSGTIQYSNTQIETNVTGESAVGAFAGTITGGSIVGSYASARNVKSTTLTGIVGGFVGHNAASISSSSFYGIVSNNATAMTAVGGFVGLNDGNIASARADVSMLAVTGSSNIGGFAGVNTSTGTIINSISAGSLQNGSGDAGGFVGLNQGAIDKNESLVNVYCGASNVGGFAGSNSVSGVITDSFATGILYNNITNVGGLVGANAGSIVRSYAIGRVSSNDASAGGLVGINTGTVTNSFWDTQKSLKGASAGGVGLTTANMKVSGSFTGWDLAAVWLILPGQYPELR